MGMVWEKANENGTSNTQMNVKRAREREKSARKKSNYIYPRQKCVFEYSVCVCVYEEVGFVFICARF